jgi:hypothetical protein
MAFSGKYQELNGLRLGDDFGRNLNQDADMAFRTERRFVTNSRQLHDRGLDNTTSQSRIPEIPNEIGFALFEGHPFPIYECKVDRFFPKP